MIKLYTAIQDKEKSVIRGQDQKNKEKNVFVQTSKWVLGNKVDLRSSKKILDDDDKIKVDDDRRQNISTMTNYNVKEVFHQIVQSLSVDSCLLAENMIKKQQHDEIYWENKGKAALINQSNSRSKSASQSNV